jgi:predicted Na+-dependent transporter
LLKMYVVPLPSARRTTLIFAGGRDTPGLSAVMAGLSQRLICPRKIAASTGPVRYSLPGAERGDASAAAHRRVADGHAGMLLLVFGEGHGEERRVERRSRPVALPLLAYFVIMWFGGFAVSRWLRLSYPRTVSLAFSAASNDFELAIAVAIGVFGVTSGQALAGVVGPLIEVPVMLALVYVALWARRRFYPAEEATP